MRNTIWDDFKLYVLQSGNVLNKLLAINIAVFVLLGLLWVIERLFSVPFQLQTSVLSWLELPGRFSGLLVKPWTIITYAFTHVEPFHLIFNMLMLYFSGRIFREFLGDRKLVSVYLLGGVAGAAAYLLAVQFVPIFDGANIPLIGASGAIMAVLVAIATLLPRYTVNLILIGPVQLIYVALFMIVMFVLSMAGSNAGGQFAHIGGALWGFLYTRSLNRGKDLGEWSSRLMDKAVSVVKPRSRLRAHSYQESTYYNRREGSRRSKISQEEVDAILDKIARSGYDSLSSNEKDTLFKASKDI